MPFLALDAGNSSTKVARWDGAWSAPVRLPADASPRDLAAALRALGPVDAAGLAAVVPTAPLLEAVRLATGLDARVVSAGLALPFRLAYRTPETLGADRLAAAAAAWALADGRPCVALDAGTALTLDAVDVRDGAAVYRGGAIAPGADLLRRTLARDTAALPDVPLPDGAPLALGDSTAACLSAGVAGMWLGGVARLLAGVAAELSAAPLVVATGGGAPWLARHLPPGALHRVEPTLVLDGVRRLVG